MYSVLVIVGHDSFGSYSFAGILVATALVHVFVASRRDPPLWSALFASQSLVAVAGLTAVALYLIRNIGLGDDVGPVLRSFLTNSLADWRTYAYFLLYVLIFTGLVVLALFLVSRLFGTRLRPELVLSAMYAASAVNLACDYAVRRPLFNVSGDQDAVGFFFAAGIFGLEHSLPLHLLVLATCASRSVRLSAGPVWPRREN